MKLFRQVFSTKLCLSSKSTTLKKVFRIVYEYLFQIKNVVKCVRKIYPLKTSLESIKKICSKQNVMWNRSGRSLPFTKCCKNFFSRHVLNNIKNDLRYFRDYKLMQNLLRRSVPSLTRCIIFEKNPFQIQSDVETFGEIWKHPERLKNIYFKRFH